GCSALLYTILLTKHPGPLTGSGGEGTRIVVDPKSPNTMYASSYYGHIMKGTPKRLGKKKTECRSIHLQPSQAEGEGEWLAATSMSPQVVLYITATICTQDYRSG
ncbi:MAG: hypothetical protein IPF93_21990, partial [Saprospiraceae bacterium]|nr:hypothetical protein [Saprospiraceae bacterium]